MEDFERQKPQGLLGYKYHFNRKIRTKKRSPEGALFEEEEVYFVKYLDMEECEQLLNPTQLKVKVGKITQKNDFTYKWHS